MLLKEALLTLNVIPVMAAFLTVSFEDVFEFPFVFFGIGSSHLGQADLELVNLLPQTLEYRIPGMCHLARVQIFFENEQKIHSLEDSLTKTPFTLRWIGHL